MVDLSTVVDVLIIEAGNPGDHSPKFQAEFGVAEEDPGGPRLGPPPDPVSTPLPSPIPPRRPPDAACPRNEPLLEFAQVLCDNARF